MTNSAIQRECRRLVIGGNDIVVVVQVTRRACSAKACVDAAGMAVLASQRNVRPGQRELCRIVIELCARPLNGGVADGAISRETGSYVVWISRRLVFGKVASCTSGRRPGVFAADMARSAWCTDVRAGQRELRVRIVVECGACPLNCRMTRLAGCGECGGHVVRVRGLLIIRQMTRETVGWSACEFTVHVTLQTRDVHMRAGQGEAGDRVVELRSGPLHGGMTRLTSGRKSGCYVIRICRLLEIWQVAGDAIR